MNCDLTYSHLLGAYMDITSMASMADLAPRVALVTGGSRGIGAATALSLAQRGYDVALTYRNKADRAQEVAREITRHGQRALWVGCDITEEADVQRLFTEL